MGSIRYILIIIGFILGFSLKSMAESFVFYTPNKGQWKEDFNYKAKFWGGTAFLSQGQNTFIFESNNFHELKHRHEDLKTILEDEKLTLLSLKQNFIGANLNCPTIQNEISLHKENYFLGNDKHRWKSNISPSKEVIYKNVYSKIDLKYGSDKNNLEYSYLIHPGGNIDDIAEQWLGADKITIVESSIVFRTALGKIKLDNLNAFQIINGIKKIVRCQFHVNKNIISYKVIDPVNPNIDLIIDPTLIFSTFSGATSDNWGMSATYDDQGNAYSAGISFGTGYVVTTGAFQGTYAGDGSGGDPYIRSDIAITKYSSDGTQRIYSTFLGGNDNELPMSIIVEENSNELILLGRTYSNNFPTDTTSFDTLFNGNCDIILTKFNASGTGIIGSTYIGGTGDDGINVNPFETQRAGLKYNYCDDLRGEVNIDQLGNIYIVGSTQSTDFPITSSAIKSTIGGSQDGYMMKFNNNLSNLNWSTYIGGSLNDALYGINFLSNGNAVITGGTESSSMSGVTFNGIHNSYQGGSADGFILQIDPSGVNVIAGTYIGTSAYDQTYLVQVDKNDNIYVMGQTKGSYSIFGAGYFVATGTQFIHKLNATLNSTVYSTRIGSGRSDIDFSPSSFLVDKCGNVYVCGWGGPLYNYNLPTSSTTGLPVTTNAFQKTTDGSDFYLCVIQRDATSLLYGTFFGGGVSDEHVDGGTSRFDKNGIVYQAICGGCGGLSDMPTTPNVVSNTNQGGNCNMAVVKFNLDLSNTVAAFVKFLSNPIGCAPLTVAFDNKSLAATNYTWDFNDSLGVTLASPTHTYNIPGTYHPFLIAINPLTCNIRDTAYTEIIVLPSPNIKISPDTTICIGAQVQIDATLSNNYTWSSSNGFNFTNSYDSSQVINSEASGYYYASTSNNYCAKKDSVYLKVNNPKPKILANGMIPACYGDEILLSDTNSFYSYSWSPQLSIADSIVVSSGGIYKLSITDSIGCIAIDTITISFRPQLLLDQCRDTITCVGTLTTIKILGDALYNYSWTNILGGSILSFTNSLTTKPYADSTYLISFTDGICREIDTIALKTSYVLANIIPLTDTSVCFGKSISLSSTIGMSAYSWNGNTASSTINVDSSGIVVLEVKNNYGCVAKDSIEVNVWPKMNLLITEDTTTCQGNQITLNASGSTSYTWQPSTGLSSNSVASPRFDGKFSTIFTIIGETHNCFDTASIMVNVLPNETKISALSDTIFCFGDSVKLISLYNANSYSWSNGNLTNSIVVSNSSNIILTNVLDNGCISNDKINILEFPQVISSTMNNANVCEGDKLQLTSNGGGRYKWTPTIYLSNDTISNPICKPNESTNYLLTVEVNGCSDTSNLKINVLPNKISLTANGPLEFCEGESVDLMLDSHQTYSWSTGALSSTITAKDSGMYVAYVSNINGCKRKDSILVNVKPHLKLNLDSSICIGESITASALGSSNQLYTWTINDSLTQHTFHEYEWTPLKKTIVTISAQNTCEAFVSKSVTTREFPILDGGGDMIITEGLSELWLIKYTGSLKIYPPTYLSCTNCPLTYVKPDSSIKYYLSAVNQYGCEILDTVNVKILILPSIYIPNCFTPEKDGLNELFKAYGHAIKDFKIKIWDRWGLFITEWSDLNYGWDGNINGEIAPVDIYVYELEATDFYQKKLRRAGTFSLVR